MFLTAVFTMLTPLCARTNVYLLVAVRILEGLFEVMIFIPPAKRSFREVYCFQPVRHSVIP